MTSSPAAATLRRVEPVPAQRAPGSHRRLSAAARRDGRVSPLELFFDLVFVLALTQCTALMADVPTVEGVAQGLLVLSALWWSWVGFAWLTSTVDPEAAVTRLVVFVAMAAFLVAALCVPGAFGGAALTFALAYAVVRAAHIVLYVLGSDEDAALRRSVLGLSASTAVGTTLLVAASATDDVAQALLWVTALLIDFAGPLAIGAAGWRLVAEHFTERHALIVIIALGESVVAVGAGVTPSEGGRLGGGVLAAGAAATALVVALWWLYFDVVALAAAQRLERSQGDERIRLARDSYSYLHLPMVAGIVLIALGLKETLGDVGAPLALVPAAALLGGTALYLLGHVAFRLRNVRTLSTQRLVVALVLLALVPVALEVPALTAVLGVTALLVGLIAYEAVRFAPQRAGLRQEALGR